MNSRVFSVDRSPVLAWNIEPQLQVPYPDMPAAAAAAISPIMPAASDPYGRCWQNQVDSGTNFPYFGALYNNSLPSAAYRVQASCMPNIGQFWPPTPPPDGCGRFDNNNLYFGPSLLRHSENVSSNIRNPMQDISHYSSLVESSKEQTQRLFKREATISPNISMPKCSSNSKSDNLGSCCIDSKLKPHNSIAYSLPKQEILTAPPGQEGYMNAPDTRTSSCVHPSTEKSYSSPYSLKNSFNFHTSSHDSSSHRAKPLHTTSQENHASPLKNVYFSHFESDNVSSAHGKAFHKSRNTHFQAENKINSSSIGSKYHHLPQSSNDLHLSNYSSTRYDFKGSHEYQNDVKAVSDGIMLIKEHFKHKTSSFKIKPEKSMNHSDCKYQKSLARSSFVQGPEYETSDMFNIPTSVMHPKMEPNEKYYSTSGSSTASSCLPSTYASTNPFFVTKALPSDLRSVASYENDIYQNNSCSLSKSWLCSELPPLSCLRSPEVASRSSSHIHSALNEESIPFAQTAPDLFRGISTQPHNPQSKSLKLPEVDDEIQIIGIQTKNSARNEGRYSSGKNSKPHVTNGIESSCSKRVNEKNPSNQDTIPSLEKCEEAKTKETTEDCPKLIPEKIITPQQIDNNLLKQPLVAECQNMDSSHEDISIKQEVIHNDPPKLSPQMTTIDYVNISDESLSNIKHEETILDVTRKQDYNLSKECTQHSFNENHGLDLLVKSIEKLTSCDNLPLPKLESVEMKSELDVLSKNESQEIKPPKLELSKNSGLDLLSAIAGHRLESEFDVADTKVDSDIKSNYPEFKCDVFSICVKTELESETNVSPSRSSVFEMQNRLDELKKKYKQKQKELSRLKPKKRFASIYLAGTQKMMKEDLDPSFFSNSSENESYGYSLCSNSTDQEEKIQTSIINPNSDTKVMDDFANSTDENSRKKLQFSLRNNSFGLETRNISSRKCPGKSKPTESSFERSENCKTSKKSLKGSSKSKTASDTASSSESTPQKNGSTKSLPNNLKMYALRHSQSSGKNINQPEEDDAAISQKVISNKRKSDNPKKYMPSKQSKLSETIIAKQLRNRILFDTSGSTSDEDNFKDGVPEDLYNALMKCHLEDESKNNCKTLSIAKSSKLPLDSPLSYPEPSKLKPEHLVESHRLLALEDSLFYAGCIKEQQSSQKYGIALDGQRGNRLHVFSQEELLSQTILESKPLTSDLPEGTRVCAYWSQQYRCLYPGVIGKAPCPSADWSEPRVFVQFDDGDSGQIPTKNVRLIPPDIIPLAEIHSMDAYDVGSSERRRSSRRQVKRARRSPTDSNALCKDSVKENESKESSCMSINDSSCDDSCFNDITSQSLDNQQNNCLECPVSPRSQRRQRKHSKRRISSRRNKSVLNIESNSSKDKSEAKMKRHKKYKEKHHRHHHHRHRHHHHRHHHHHSKKHRHKRKGKDIPIDDNLTPHPEDGSDLKEHSTGENLPQCQA